MAFEADLITRVEIKKPKETAKSRASHKDRRRRRRGFEDEFYFERQIVTEMGLLFWVAAGLKQLISSSVWVWWPHPAKCICGG